MAEPDVRARLADLMDQRRRDLRLTWDQVASRAGIHRETLRQIRSGASDTIRPLSAAGLEDALEWKRGSIDATLHGSDPIPDADVGMNDEQGWQRLSEAVRARRDECGWTQLDVAARGGPSIDRIQAIEGARTNRYSARTFAKLEHALEWERGTCRAILGGGSFAEAAPPTAAPPLPENLAVLVGSIDNPAPPEPLARALAEVTANLDAYIERRAQEIAAPRIAAVEKQAREQIADLERKAADDRQRASDLVAELRRHVDAQVRRAERAEKKLTERTGDA